MIRSSLWNIAVACASATLLLAGCQSGYRSTSTQIVAAERAGQYETAASTASVAARASEGDAVSRVIYLLEAGRTAQIAGDLEASTEFYAKAFDLVLPYLDTKPDARVSEAIATTLVNQTLAEYRGTVVERIMLSTLQAINRLALGQYAEARIELNRARDWQQDAVEKAQEQIAQSEKRLSQKADDSGIPAGSLEVPAALRSAYSGLGDLEAYADWRNPFTSWLRGIYLIANAGDDGDLGNARFDLREVVAMNPEARALVDPDLLAIERRAPAPTTWVLFMSGLAPRLEEFRLDIPIPVGNVNYVAAAFPVLEPMDGALTELTLRVGGDSIAGVRLADVDAMVAADYEKRLPVIVMQEILSAAIKTTATWAAAQAAGDSQGIVNLAGIVYQAVTTAADLRTWRTLPKFIYAGRLATPDSGPIELRSTGDRLLGSVEVVPGAYNLVIAILPDATAPVARVQSIRLDPGPGVPPAIPAPGTDTQNPSERSSTG
ncbi:MAG: hypothetical protein VX641_07025 [Planctomycetota bacterium]|nr:hypothetical protein [Planctomycetota bacterium]